MRGPSLSRLFVSYLVPVIGFAGIFVPVASAAVQNRITSTISDESRKEVPDSVNPRVSRATDLGPAAADTRLQGMTLRLSMTAEQQAALNQLLIDLQNPSSTRYHQWLTPDQYAAQFGVSDADMGKVTRWLTSQGFTITGVAGGDTVTFDGTVSQVQAAFGTSIHNLDYKGEVHFANMTNPVVPTAMANVVGGITGLHNFRFKPRYHATVVTPQYTSSISGSHFLAPGDLYTIYDMNSLLNGGINGAGIGTGANCHSVAGATCGDIAVVGQVDIVASDVTAFRTASGLSSTNLPITVHEGGDPGSPTCSTNSCSPNNSDLAEASIDVQWSGAMAPSATILFVNGPDVIFNSLTQAIKQNLAPIITVSYGACEAAWGVTDLNMINQTLMQANAQGQTVLSATGDVGAADCDAGTTAVEGLSVDFPASSPYVTAMGGTMFNDGSATGATTDWSTTNGTTGGSANSYIPETVWNEDTTGSTFSAGGGGVSAFFTKPAWQVETGAAGMTTLVPADSSRDIPDISLDAAAGHDQYLYCQSGSCVTGYRRADTTLTTAGGTSFDSQIFGGMLALIEQKIGGRVGNANVVLYALGNNAAFYNTTSTSVFHDITAGNNSDPCTGGTPNCPNGGTVGYNAGVGYDLATGWGTVDLANLANDWKLVTPLGIGSLGTTTSTTALTASTTSPASGASVTLTATVTGSGGTPTGTVQFLNNNVALGSSVALVNGVATYTFVTSCSTLGQQNMSAVYSGDATYAGSKGPALSANGATQTSNGSYTTTPLIVTVSSGTCPDFTVTPSQATVSVAPAGTIPAITITVAPLNSFTGTVSFSASSQQSTSFIPGLTFSPSTVTITSGSATTSLTMTGIVANLQLPKLPGHVDSGTMLAKDHSYRTKWYAGSGITFASLLLIMLPRKRRLGGLLVLALTVALVGGATGCGGSSQALPPAANQYVGTYVVTVVATYTSSTKQVTSHSTTITYQIN
jgi:subtilase family serine protease